MSTFLYSSILIDLWTLLHIHNILQTFVNHYIQSQVAPVSMAMYLLTSYVVLFTHVHLCYPLFPSVAMDMLFLWQLEVFMDGLMLHCRGLSEPFFTHSLQAHWQITPAEHSPPLSWFDPSYLLKGHSISFCMPVLRCTKVIMFWSIVQPAVLCKSTRGPENLTVGIRSDEILDAGTVIRFVVCTLLKLESAPQAF